MRESACQFLVQFICKGVCALTKGFLSNSWRQEGSENPASVQYLSISTFNSNHLNSFLQ